MLWYRFCTECNTNKNLFNLTAQCRMIVATMYSFAPFSYTHTHTFSCMQCSTRKLKSRGCLGHFLVFSQCGQYVCAYLRWIFSHSILPISNAIYWLMADALRWTNQSKDRHHRQSGRQMKQCIWIVSLYVEANFRIRLHHPAPGAMCQLTKKNIDKCVDAWATENIFFCLPFRIGVRCMWVWYRDMLLGSSRYTTTCICISFGWWILIDDSVNLSTSINYHHCTYMRTSNTHTKSSSISVSIASAPWHQHLFQLRFTFKTNVVYVDLYNAILRYICICYLAATVYYNPRMLDHITAYLVVRMNVYKFYKVHCSNIIEVVEMLQVYVTSCYS